MMTQGETMVQPSSEAAMCSSCDESLFEPLTASTSSSLPLNEGQQSSQDEDHFAIITDDDADNDNDATDPSENPSNSSNEHDQKISADDLKLASIFISMVLVGTGVSVFGKLVVSCCRFSSVMKFIQRE